MQSIMICVFICGNAINLNKPEIYSYSSHFIQIFKFTLLVWLLQSWVSNSLILNQSIEKMVRSTFYLKHLKKLLAQVSAIWLDPFHEVNSDSKLSCMSW